MATPSFWQRFLAPLAQGRGNRGRQRPNQSMSGNLAGVHEILGENKIADPYSTVGVNSAPDISGFNTYEGRNEALRKYADSLRGMNEEGRGGFNFIDPTTGSASWNRNEGSRQVSVNDLISPQYANFAMRQYRPQKVSGGISPTRNKAMRQYVTGSVYALFVLFSTIATFMGNF